MFDEEDTLDSTKDTFDFIPGFVGSYPNAFAVVDYKELHDFFDIIKNFDGSENSIKKFEKYYIKRSNKDFWKYYDWFQERFYKEEPITSGLFDLNRYYYR